MDAEIVLDARAELGEGTLWDIQQQHLFWIDILGKKLHFYTPETGENNTFSFDQPVGTVVPKSETEVLLALHDGIYSFNYTTENLFRISDLEAERKGNRFNDGKCDPLGRFWIGSVSCDCNVPGAGSLYRIEADLRVTKILSDLTIANGICWSSRKNEMYYIDSPTHEVWRFDYDPSTGDITNRSTVVYIPEEEGIPDGMTIDSQDNLWVAHFGGGKIGCYSSSTGKKLSEVSVPARQVTSCAFGGPKLDTLYISTARVGLDDSALRKQPLAGGLFQAFPGVQGVPAPYFGGW